MAVCQKNQRTSGKMPEVIKINQDRYKIETKRNVVQCNEQLDVLVFFFSLYPQLAEELLTKEVVNYDDIAAILGPCPYGDKRAHFNLPEAP